MKFTTILLLGLVVFIATIISSCNVKSSSGNKNIQTHPKSQTSPEKVVRGFFTWFIKDIYPKSAVYAETPNFKLAKDSTYYLDSAGQFNLLRKTGFFSESYYKNQEKKYSGCDIQLQKVTVKEVNKCGCFPTDFVKNDDCDFLMGHVWVGGQGENITDVKIKNTQITEDLARVITTVFVDNVEFSHPMVTLLKEGEEWRISKIDLKY